MFYLYLFQNILYIFPVKLKTKFEEMRVAQAEEKKQIDALRRQLVSYCYTKCNT